VATKISHQREKERETDRERDTAKTRDLKELEACHDEINL
jgi:hypothetical protein